jgi:hypothetical protein
MSTKTKHKFLIFLIILVSCGQDNQIDEPANTKISQSTTNTPALTQRAELETVTLLSTLDDYITPSITSAPTPIPTLSEDELLDVTEIVVSLLSGVEDCKLPCFMGISPGVTSWSKVVERFSPIAYDISLLGNAGYIYIQVSEELNPPLQFLQIDLILDEDQIVTRMKAFTGRVDNYSLSQILDTYGKPDEIRIGTWASGPADAFWLRYYLYYANLKTIIYYLSHPTITSQAVQICPSNDNAPDLMAWSTPSQADFLDIVLAYEHRGINDYPHLSAVSDYDIDDFFDIFKDSAATECIDFSRELFEIW